MPTEKIVCRFLDKNSVGNPTVETIDLSGKGFLCIFERP